jgi:hypothetical protein
VGFGFVSILPVVRSAIADNAFATMGYVVNTENLAPVGVDKEAVSSTIRWVLGVPSRQRSSAQTWMAGSNRAMT